MARKPLHPGGKLVPFNTRMPKGLKQLIDALVTVQDLDGQRDLIERALEAYRDTCPADFEKATRLIELLNDKAE